MNLSVLSVGMLDVGLKLKYEKKTNMEEDLKGSDCELLGIIFMIIIWGHFCFCHFVVHNCQ